MESNITIRAKLIDMERFFDKNDVCSVRLYKKLQNGMCKVLIRHGERGQKLSGLWTIPQIVKKLRYCVTIHYKGDGIIECWTIWDNVNQRDYVDADGYVPTFNTKEEACDYLDKMQSIRKDE